MAFRRSFKDLKKTGVRLPLLAWSADRVLPYFFLLLIAATALAGPILFKATKDGVREIQAPKVVESSYLPLTPEQTPAGKWAKRFLATTPPNVTAWAVSNTTAPGLPLTFQECSSMSLPAAEQLARYTASGKEASLQLLLYPAGQAPAAFGHYQELLAKCFSLTSAFLGEPQTTVYSWSGGSIFTYGDVIFVLRADDSKLLATLTPWLVEQASKSLEENGCAALVVVPSDAYRNLYAAGRKYTGWLLKDTLKTKVSLEGIPTLVLQEAKEASYRDKPEGPLSPLIPSEPSAVKKPQVPEAYNAKTPSFTKTITYEEVDSLGPGCGWRWTSLKQPVVDAKGMLAAKTKLYTDTQLGLDTQARSYINDRIQAAADTITLAQQLEAWNSYVEQLSTVHKKWAWLEEQRQAIYDPWTRYVWAHDEWMNFDINKANALKQYNSEVDACNAANKELTDWEAKWGAIAASQPTAPVTTTPKPVPVQVTVTPKPVPITVAPAPAPTAQASGSSAPAPTQAPQPQVSWSQPAPTVSTSWSQPPVIVTTPTPTVIYPPKPAGCTAPPVKPAILSRGKGSEPKPPAMAAGVTIPNSWQQPAKSPTVTAR